MKNQNWVPETADNHSHDALTGKDRPVADLIDIFHAQKIEVQKQHEAISGTLTKLEGSLRAHEDLFELSPISFFILDKNGIIERANARAGFHLEFDPKLLVGRNFSDFLIDEPDKSSFYNHMELVNREQKIVQLECEVKRESGAIFPALIKSIVLTDDSGGFKHMFTILTDISRIKDHEHQVEAALQKAERLNEMFSSFVSIASHEFRTPLSAVLSSNSLVEKYAKLGQTDMMHKHLARIKSSVKMMVNIMEDFLSLEKLESETVEVVNTNFNLVSFSEDLIEEIRPQTKPDQQINYINLGKPEVSTDKKVLQHIVLNLLSNACKYSEENKEIRFTTDVRNDRILIIVQDSGIGIPEAQKEKIFTRFFRAKNATSIHGTGLGLYICKRYVELLNGSIFFTSEANKGTIFTLEIPQVLN